MQENTPKLWMTTKNAANILGISNNALRILIANGEMPALKNKKGYIVNVQQVNQTLMEIASQNAIHTKQNLPANKRRRIPV